MAVTLSNRAELRLAFYRITGTGPNDGALSENETTAGDNVNRYLFDGMREAQLWLIDRANGARWTTSAALTVTPDPSVTGAWLADLPTDFLRAIGDRDNSPLRQPNGNRWGRMVTRDESDWRGNFFWIEDSHIRFTRQATPPHDLMLDYNYLVPELTDDSTSPDFPDDDRQLIVAFAAREFALHPQFPQPSRVPVIDAYLDQQKRNAARRGRRSRDPKRLKVRQPIAGRWFI